jgi:hypothetical protein
VSYVHSQGGRFHVHLAGRHRGQPGTRLAARDKVQTVRDLLLAGTSKMRVAIEATFMAKSDQKPGSQSTHFPVLYLPDFLPDAEGSQHGLLESSLEHRTADGRDHDQRRGGLSANLFLRVAPV